MSIEADVQRTAIEMLVDMNPTSVIVNRVEYVVDDDKGTRRTEESTIGPFNIALYNNTAMIAPKAVQIIEDGGKLDKVEWSALAKKDADFESGGNVSDSFYVEGKGKFRVITALDIETSGEVTGKLLFLEMLK